jgi:eukaryotic-like serine/threonine-protein kinase
MPEASEVLSDRYELQEIIASGGMAVVWRAKDQVLARTVAIKVLHDHLADDEPFLSRFRREAIAAAGLNHPHVVSIYDTGEMEADTAPCHYIVMEHCGGGTLGGLLRDEGPFSSERVASIGAAVCEALAYAHSKNILHRDVKPGNILLGDDGLLKVGDFGIAKAIAEKHDITTTGQILGTVAYISPEYATDQDLDARSDLYSLGVVLYELAVGKPPFAEGSSVATAMRHVNDPVPSMRSMRAGISRPLEIVIMKALAKEPAARYGSAEEMGEALQRIAPADGHVVRRNRQPASRTAAHEGSSFRGESRWVVPVLALIVGAVVLAAIAGALFEDSPITDQVRRNQSGDAGVRLLQVDAPTDFDPEGDGTEDSGGLTGLVDGSDATVWKTDIYGTPLQEQKNGVGVLFDLGREVEISRVEVVTPSVGLELELLAGNTAPSAIEDLESVGTQSAGTETLQFETEMSARYWVVWITDLPGGGPGLGQLAEVRFFGR